MNYGKALYIADKFVEAISPFCERVEIAGSVRRKKAECGDIEVVCIPKIEDYIIHDGLFTRPITGRSRKFIEIVDSMNIYAGDAEFGKYMKRYSGKAQIKFDIFVACKENWGYIYAIRTGSSNFSNNILAHGWRKAGYCGCEGFLYSQKDCEQINKKWVKNPDAKYVPVYEEIDLFNLIGIDYVEPENRKL